MSDLEVQSQNPVSPTLAEDAAFAEFRRKMRHSEALSAAMLRLLFRLRFTGRISVVVQNGRVLKCGYEEGYFRAREGKLLP
jgi:hypothetical protein